MFYLESAGQTVFYSWLHLFPNGYDATWAAVMWVDAALIGLSAFCLGVAFTSTRVIVASTAGFLLFALEPTRTFAQSVNGLLPQSWIPVQTLWCFLFLVCSLIYLLSVKPSGFILVGLAATWVAQRYIVLVPIAFICLTLGWFVAWRTVDPRRRGKFLAWGITVVVALCIPNLLGVAFDWPWQFSNYLHAVAHQVKDPRTVVQAFDLVATFWGLHQAWIFALLLLAGMGLTYVVYRMKPSAERTGYLAIVATIYLGTLVAVIMTYSVNSSVDQLHAYELSFYLGIVALGYGTIAIVILRWWIAYAVVPIALGFGNFGAPPAVGFVDMGSAQSAIIKAASGRAIEYVSVNPDNWIWIDGMLLENVQAGRKSCAVRFDHNSEFVFALQHLCSAAHNAAVAKFAVNPGENVVGGQTIYTSKDLDIVKLPS